MNPILTEILHARQGHYVHALEVYDVEELRNTADVIFDEFSAKHSKEVIVDFLNSLDIYCLDESVEKEVYKFNFRGYLRTL